MMVRAVGVSTSRIRRYRATPIPKPEVSRIKEVPTAATVVRRGTLSSGKPMRNTGMSRAAPLMPLNIATEATTTQTGSMNQ